MDNLLHENGILYYRVLLEEINISKLVQSRTPWTLHLKLFGPDGSTILQAQQVVRNALLKQQASSGEVIS